jgi:hypothetical protein
MPDAHRDAAIAYIDMLVRETGLDLTNLARRAEIASTTLTRFRNDPGYRNSLSGRTLKKLSDATGVPLPADLGGGVPTSFGTDGASTAVSRPPSTSPVPRDLPVLGCANTPHQAYSFRNEQVQSYVERPWFLFGHADAYAVRVNDTSMEPALSPGQLVYVAPAIPASAGDDVVVQFPDGTGAIKRLHRRTSKSFALEQLSPKRIRNVEPEEVRAIHLIAAVVKLRI